MAVKETLIELPAALEAVSRFFGYLLRRINEAMCCQFSSQCKEAGRLGASLPERPLVRFESLLLGVPSIAAGDVVARSIFRLDNAATISSARGTAIIVKYESSIWGQLGRESIRRLYLIGR